MSFLNGNILPQPGILFNCALMKDKKAAGSKELPAVHLLHILLVGLDHLLERVTRRTFGICPPF